MSVTIIGAGLSGLATAYRLQQANIDVQVVEANPYPGGRIQPAVQNGHQDLGPTWVWPYAQPVVTKWLDELQLKLLEQFDAGTALMDLHPDEPAKQQIIPGQHGISRINGGTFALINALIERLSVPIKFDHVVNKCSFTNDRWSLDITGQQDGQDSTTLMCDSLIIAAPPRLAANLIPSDSADKDLAKAQQILMATETWMAPHAKVVVLYKTSFWRDTGLSGRVASRVGPLVEIHDHSGPDGNSAALFGFCGVPAHHRKNATVELTDAISQQLKRCFGSDSPEPTQIIIKDWAFEPYTTTEADRSGTGAHPRVLPAKIQQSFCSNSLWFAASETSVQSPGLIEGALARADVVSQEVIALLNA